MHNGERDELNAVDGSAMTSLSTLINNDNDRDVKRRRENGQSHYGQFVTTPHTNALLSLCPVRERAREVCWPEGERVDHDKSDWLRG